MLSFVLFCAFESSLFVNSPLLTAKRKFKFIKKMTKTHCMKKFKTASNSKRINSVINKTKKL